MKQVLLFLLLLIGVSSKAQQPIYYQVKNTFTRTILIDGKTDKNWVKETTDSLCPKLICVDEKNHLIKFYPNENYNLKIDSTTNTRDEHGIIVVTSYTCTNTNNQKNMAVITNFKNEYGFFELAIVTMNFMTKYELVASN